MVLDVEALRPNGIDQGSIVAIKRVDSELESRPGQIYNDFNVLNPTHCEIGSK